MAAEAQRANSRLREQGSIARRIHALRIERASLGLPAQPGTFLVPGGAA